MSDHFATPAEQADYFADPRVLLMTQHTRDAFAGSDIPALPVSVGCSGACEGTGDCACSHALVPRRNTPTPFTTEEP